MRTIERSNKFKKDWKRELKKPGIKKLEQEFRVVLKLLLHDEPLPAKYSDHPLVGSTNRDCHVRPDRVLIYNIDDPEILRLVRIGSHSDLF